MAAARASPSSRAWCSTPRNGGRQPAGAIHQQGDNVAVARAPGEEFGGDAIADLFLNRLDSQAHPYYAGIAGLRVSSHFLIRRDGALLQFVPCLKRAWHAGQSQWCGRERCNDFSVGIELEGADDQPFSDAQYECLSVLARALYARYPIQASVGHADIAPGRKTDPGPHFSWTRYFSALEK